MAGKNRNERRPAASKSSKSDAKSTGASIQPTTEIDEDGVEYLLQHPDRSGPKGKTLFDLAEERQRELDNANPAKRKLRERNASAGADDEELGPMSDAFLYSMSMAALHLTLDVIVYTQYREEVVWSEIIKRAGTALPIFGLLVYLTHVDFSNRFPVLRNLVFLIGSVAAGCYMVYSGNKNGYFYVMKAAPPIGTLWIWSVVEMNLPYAALSAASVFGYLWWNGFDFF